MLEYSHDYLAFEKYRDLGDTFEISKDITADYYAHFHSAVEIRYVIEGQTKSCINGVSRLSSRGEIIFVNPYDMHQYFCSDVAEVYTLIIGSNYLDDFFSQYGQKQFPNFLNDCEGNAPIFNLFNQLYAGRQTLNAMERQAYVNLLLSGLAKRYPLSERKPGYSLILQIVKFIYEHCSDSITIKTLAKEFNYAEMSFSRLFRTHIGTDLRVYVNNVRVGKVRQMLADPAYKDQSLTSIVYANGFRSLATFYRTYRRRYGGLPDRTKDGDAKRK